MIVGLDTSVVVRLLSGQPEQLAEVALEYLRARQRAHDRVFISEWVRAETYYAHQYHYGAPKKDTLDAQRSFLATPGNESTGQEAEVMATRGLETAKPG
jgi:predicted nucleic acid-binding protein